MFGLRIRTPPSVQHSERESRRKAEIVIPVKVSKDPNILYSRQMKTHTAGKPKKISLENLAAMPKISDDDVCGRPL